MKQRPVMKRRRVLIGGLPYDLPYYVFEAVPVVPCLFGYDALFYAERTIEALTARA